MLKDQVIGAIRREAAMAVIRGESEEQALDAIEQCVAGGIRIIELTFTVPFAQDVMKAVAKKFGEQIVLGAGTVLDSETARIAILSGAEFIVSPCFNADMVKLCNRYQKPVICGVMTVTEAVTAMEAGCEILKLFPAGTLGIPFLKALQAPLPQIQIIPTGGVSAANAADWLKAGAVAVGLGGKLLQGDITANARELVQVVRRAKEEQA